MPLISNETIQAAAKGLYTPLDNPVVTEEQPAPSPMLSAPVPVLDPSEVQDVVDLLPQVEGVGELFDTNWACLTLEGNHSLWMFPEPLYTCQFSLFSFDQVNKEAFR